MALLVGPFLYLYCRTLTGSRPIGRLIALHFLPALALALLEARWHLALSFGQKLWALQMDRDQPAALDPVQVAIALQLLLYLVASLRLLSRRAEELKGVASNLDRISFRWLRRLLGVSLALYVAWVPTVGPRYEWAQDAAALAVPLAIFILVWSAMQAPHAFLGNQEPEPVPAPDPAPELPQDVAEEEAESDKYRKSRLPPAMVQHYQQRLARTMEAHRGFLDPDLSLPRLAEQVAISPHHLSQVLNEGLGLRFCDYVNALRVEEARRLLQDPACADLPVLEVAMRAGFSSKATFNAVFKRTTGSTPTAWRQVARRGQVA
jgi:AraC-like DNA-binding protein